MILGGMGPVDPLRSFGSKLFASLYALYSGMVLLESPIWKLQVLIYHALLVSVSNPAYSPVLYTD